VVLGARTISDCHAESSDLSVGHDLLHMGGIGFFVASVLIGNSHCICVLNHLCHPLITATVLTLGKIVGNKGGGGGMNQHCSKIQR